VTKANKIAPTTWYDRRVREEQEAAQREILERRRNPEKMEEYEAKFISEHQELA
jgi:hypothetical protein